MSTHPRYPSPPPLAMLVLLLSAGIGPATAADASDPAFIQRHWQTERSYLQALVDLVQAGDWRGPGRMLDEAAAVRQSDRDATDVLLRRTTALLAHLEQLPEASDLTGLADELGRLAVACRTTAAGSPEREGQFLAIASLRRRLLFAHPALAVERILFMNANAPYTGHVSGIGPVASSDVCYSAMKKGKNRGLPRHVDNGRIAYMMDDWYHPPSGREGAHWTHPRFRSTLYDPPKDSRRGSGPPGLVELTGFKEGNPTCRPLLASATVTEGPNAGIALSDGTFVHDWDIDFDGSRIVFAWMHRRMVNVYLADLTDGTVRQLTDTVWSDFNPIFLPDGRLVFRSSRRFVIDRCQPWDHENYTQRHCSTLFSMKDDGSDVYPISWHETNEAHPAVDNDGRLVFTRWDYIDRGFNAAQHIWHCFPDGRDPRALHGNYQRPYWKGDTEKSSHGQRATGEVQARALPDTTGRYIVIGSGHHNVSSGNPLIIDTTIPDDGMGSQVEHIIDGIGMAGDQNGGAGFTTITPLTDSLYLVTLQDRKSISPSKKVSLPPLTPHAGVFLLDRFGNLEPLVTDALFDKKYHRPSSYWRAVPFGPRPRPPVIPTATCQGERRQTPGHKRATLALMNVYEADFTWPEDRVPTELRVVRLWGRPWARPGGHYPEIGYTKGSVGRMSLGTVPIEKDGSAYLEAPVEAEIYFQVLDQHGRAIQSMRSGTYVHPGEQMTCFGCHEDKWRPGSLSSTPQALQRAPSRLRPEPGGPWPQTFARLVQPMLEQRCQPCHQEAGKGPQKVGYFDLKPLSWHYSNGGLGADTPFSRSTVGKVGAAGSRGFDGDWLSQHRDRLEPEEIRRISLWLDLNSGAISDYMHEEEQVLGRIVWPWEATDLLNPLQLERDRPLAKQVVPPGGLAALRAQLQEADWQRRHAAYEAVRQLGAQARDLLPILQSRLDGLEPDERLECEPLLRAIGAVDAKAYAAGVASVAAVVQQAEPAEAFIACQALRFLGEHSAPALAAYVHAAAATDYDLAQAGTETLVGLGTDARPAIAGMRTALANPHPRIVALLARALRQAGAHDAATVTALTEVLHKRRGDYTWLGSDAETLATIPAVQRRHALLTGTVYEKPDRWGERQPAMLVAACNVERGWERKMVTACARALGPCGSTATSSIPALVDCAALDAGDLPVLRAALQAIDPAAALAHALERFAASKDEAQSLRLASLVGLLIEALPDQQREPAIQSFAAGQPDPSPALAETMQHWQAVLRGEKPDKKQRKKQRRKK